MKKSMNIRRARKKPNKAFVPSHIYIENAVRYYLEKGGKITRIEFDKNSYKDFISTGENPLAVDEFLGHDDFWVVGK